MQFLKWCGLVFCSLYGCTLSIGQVLDQNQAATPQAAEAPANDPMAQLDDQKTINTGDLLSVIIREDREGPQIMLVDEQGMLLMPYTEPIMAKGLTYKALAYKIKDELEKSYYKVATVLVSPATLEGTRGSIFVLGQVLNPGSVKIPTNEILTASRAILQAGVIQTSDLTLVSVVRKDPQNPSKDLKMTVNVSDVINNGNFAEDIIVRAGDLIFVPSQGASIGQILMSGAIRQPGPMDIPIGGKFMLTDAIFRAGGFADFADDKKVKIIRKDQRSKNGETTIIVDVSKIMNQGKRELDQPLFPEDVIIVPEKWFNF